MSKENKHALSKVEGLIPELRFPEFKNEGEWEENELNYFCFNISSGKDKVSEEGEFPLYGSTGIIGKTDNISYSGDYILVARVGANAGFLNRAKGKFGVTDNTLVLDLKNVDIIDFIHFSLEKISLNKLVFGSGQPLITGGQLKSLQLVSPKSGKEQQKIASCLSSLDDLITAHSQKLELLKDHKKGLMQNLFPDPESSSGGEKVPKYRFKEFEKDGEWVEKTLGEVFSTYSGGTPSTTEKEFYGGKIPFIRSAEISKDKTELFLTEAGLNNSSAKMVKKGDLLIALYGANSGDVAISKIDGAINQAILCLKSEFSNEFTCHYLFHKKDWIIARYLQGGQGNLSGDIVKSIELSFPSKAEQQKIASCLSSLDALITAQAEKIEQLKWHKKGLMQGLFPKIND